jgi:hypothetical protein
MLSTTLVYDPNARDQHHYHIIISYHSMTRQALSALHWWYAMEVGHRLSGRGAKKYDIS